MSEQERNENLILIIRKQLKTDTNTAKKYLHVFKGFSDKWIKQQLWN